jgi:hypothetical protein
VLVARAAQQRLDAVLHVAPASSSGSCGGKRMEVRVGLEREVVGRDVRHAERDRFAHVGERRSSDLAGQRVHQVRVHRGEESRAPLRARAAPRPRRARGRWPRARVVEALHAERQAVHARVAVAAEALASKVPGLASMRDLGVGIDRDARAHAVRAARSRRPRRGSASRRR